MKNNFANKMYQKFIKPYYKFILMILIYALYQSNLLTDVLSIFKIDFFKLNKKIKILILFINDLIYVISALLLFKDDIKKGLKDIKENYQERSYLAIKCWALGCILMTVSSTLINIFIKKDMSNNEEIVRGSIKIAPIYMLFSCSISAPVLEELVFRKSIDGLIKNKKIFIIVSGLTFGLLHIIFSDPTLVDFLYVIPYGAMGSCFAYLLTKTKNITLPIIIHMLHNTILVIGQILNMR